jgi:hypothetical protein
MDSDANPYARSADPQCMTLPQGKPIHMKKLMEHLTVVVQPWRQTLASNFDKTCHISAEVPFKRNP